MYILSKIEFFVTHTPSVDSRQKILERNIFGDHSLHYHLQWWVLMDMVINH